MARTAHSSRIFSSTFRTSLASGHDGTYVDVVAEAGRWQQWLPVVLYSFFTLARVVYSEYQGHCPGVWRVLPGLLLALLRLGGHRSAVTIACSCVAVEEGDSWHLPETTFNINVYTYRRRRSGAGTCLRTRTVSSLPIVITTLVQFAEKIPRLQYRYLYVCDRHHQASQQRRKSFSVCFFPLVETCNGLHPPSP